MRIIPTACFTGHRPKYLESYNPRSPKNNAMLLELRKIIIDHIENKDVSIFITGMALGIDMWAARIVLALRGKYPHLQLVAAIPCKNQEKKWLKHSQDEWQSIIDKCDHVHYVSEEEYTPWCMNIRNEWMVNNSDYVIGVHDGSKGGTFNCIEYARRQGKEITRLNPHTLEVS